MAVSDQLVKLYFIKNHHDLVYMVHKTNPGLVTEMPHIPRNNNFSVVETTPGYVIYKVNSMIIKKYTPGGSVRLFYKVKNVYLAFLYEDPGVTLKISCDNTGRTDYLTELDLPRDVIDKLLEHNIITDTGIYGFAINTSYVEKKFAENNIPGCEIE